MRLVGRLLRGLATILPVMRQDYDRVNRIPRAISSGQRNDGGIVAVLGTFPLV